STIDSATLTTFNTTFTRSGSLDLTIDFDGVNTQSWSEFGLTWNTQPGVTGNSRNTINSSVANGNVSWDVTQALRGAWGVGNQCGLRIKSDASAGSASTSVGFTFSSREVSGCQLSVNYTIPNNAPNAP